MRIEILGDGCTKCRALKERVTQAVQELDLRAEVVSVMDPETLAGYGAQSLPCLVVDGEIKAGGATLSLEKIKQLLA